jgi:hypothetical protein
VAEVDIKSHMDFQVMKIKVEEEAEAEAEEIMT